MSAPGPAAAPLPRPRILFHPGPANPVRINARESERARHVRLSLQPGRSLLDAIVEPLAEIGIHSASMTILGGWFSRLDYCVAPPDPSGKTVIAYSEIRPAGASCLIFGNATLGLSLVGKPLVHCHGTILTEAGEMRGGHMIPESCIIGSQPVPVLVTAFDRFTLRQAYDPETRIPLLQPSPGVPHG